MPYIHVRITDDKIDREKKRAIVAGCTQLMVDLLNKDPAKTFVVIEEVAHENWGIGYELVAPPDGD